jgi:Domain of unknown function (DUF5667)
MTDEFRRALELERRLDSMHRDGAVAGELDSLETLARRVQKHLTPPAAGVAFAASSRRRLLHRLRMGTAKAPPRPSFGLVRRLAYVVATVLTALALSTTGIAYAAQDSLPGDALYGVKRGIERARQSLTTNPQSQAALFSDLAAERMREVQGLAEAGREELIGQTLDDYGRTLDQLQAAADVLPEGERGRLLMQATVRVQQHRQVLERLLGQVAPQAVPAIERAIERSSHGEEVLEALQKGQSPSDLAPGQNKTKQPGPKRTPGPPGTKIKP